MQINHIDSARWTKYLLLFLFMYLGACASPNRNEEDAGMLPVKRVVDGDTFWVEDGTEKGMKVRLIGVDTPETVHPQKPVEFYGKEASDFVKKMLEGKKVKLEYDVQEKDRYGRTLAYVYLEDGTFLNAELVRQGYAQVMTIPPNVKFSELFLDLQKKAREGELGLWSE
ncbi:MAG: thermonuclease family protein [Bacteroidota bacterium]